MPEREVKQVLATYVDEHGATRYALAGQTVSVHPDHVKQFDELNGGAPDDTPPDTTPKRRTRTPKETWDSVTAAGVKPAHFPGKPAHS